MPLMRSLLLLTLSGIAIAACSACGDAPCEETKTCNVGPDPTGPTTTSSGAGGAPTTTASSSTGVGGAGGGSEHPTAVAVAASGQHSCAALTDGTTWCWGSNFNGSLGTAVPVEQSLVPVLSGLVGVTAMSGGVRNMCGIKDGQVWCWGDGEYGALGNNDNAISSTPVRAGSLEGVTSLSGDGEYYCAVAQGEVWCWGNGTYWTLGGSPPTGGESPVPVNLIGLTDATEVATADRYACALRSAGSVTCWGDNEQASVPGSNTPSTLLNANVQSISASARSSHTCLTRFDQVYCWGSAHSSGATTVVTSPTQVQGLGKVDAIAVGGRHTCALVTGEGVYCWGEPPGNGRTTVSNTPILIPGTQDAQQMSAGFQHTCALLEGGSVACWGENGDGRLGNGTTVDSTKAETVFPAWQ